MNHPRKSTPRRKGPGGGRRGGRSAGRPREAGERPARPSKIEPLHPSDEPPDIQSFREWPLVEAIQQSIANMGIEVPTPIQRLAIQHVLDGRDVIAKAETGTGKTLAFGAPMMSKIDPDRATVLGLVLCPTRELAQQVAAVLCELGEARGISVALIVGGEPMHGQVEALKGGAQVVVGTPGRVLDLYGQGFLSFPWTEFVVLDEADEMLEIGFIDDVKKILSFTPDERQTLHFSATFPRDVLALARESTREPAEIATAAGVSTVDTITQSFMQVETADRALALTRLIEGSRPDDVFLVFCDRRTEVDTLLRRMTRLPYSIKALHGGYDQASRFRVMSAFRTGEVKALLATDVASRGLDVNHVTHVINYGVPQGVEDYTHRIGRTGRAGRSGYAITIVSRENRNRWRQIQAQAPWDIPEIEMPGRAPSARGRGERRERSERPERRERSERGARAEPRRPQRSRRPQDDAAPKPATERAPDEVEAPAAPQRERRPRRGMSTRERLARERGETETATEPATETSERPPRRRRESRPRTEETPARTEDADRAPRERTGKGRGERTRREPKPASEESGRQRSSRREDSGRGAADGFGAGL